MKRIILWQVKAGKATPEKSYSGCYTAQVYSNWCFCHVAATEASTFQDKPLINCWPIDSVEAQCAVPNNRLI